MNYKILIIIILISLLIIFGAYVVFARIRLNKVEDNLQYKFKKRNNKIISLFYISKNYLNKHKEVFQEFITLKEKDFLETSLNYYFENKISTYDKIHKEIDFIFKLCEMNEKLKKDEKYAYIKEEIINETHEIGNEYVSYKQKFEKYQKIHKISKIFVFGLLLR